LRSSAPVATSQTSQRGATAASRGASSTSAPRPEALSSAPGVPGIESACAIRITRQSAGVSRIPITLRERPLPGTVKRLLARARPARLNAARTRSWARRSAADAAGRGPSRATDAANR
jgi:hypothetical protein